MGWNMGKSKHIFNVKVIIGSIALISLVLCRNSIIKEVNSWNVKHIAFHNKVIVVQVLGMTSNTFSTDPEGLDTFDFKWTSSNENIATVSNSGIVKALAIGEVTITARSRNGVIDTYTVKVIEHY